MQANFIVDLGSKAQVPIISYSATSPSVSSVRTPYFVRAAQNDSSQVKTISSLVQAFGWRAVVPVYVDNEFGEGIVPSLLDAFQDIDARIPYRSVISSYATDDQIEAELYKLMTMQTRVFVVHMFPSLASRLFTKAKEVGMLSEGYVWILTDSVTNFLSSLDHTVIDSMQGVLGVRPYVGTTKKLDNFTTQWKTKFRQQYPSIVKTELNVFGLWAYDAATSLAMAVESIGATNGSFQRTNNSANSSELDSFAILQMGPQLLQALLNTTFTGLCGDFHITDGQIRQSAYEIVNVFGTGVKEVGFWTPEAGLVRKISINNTNSTSAVYKTLKENLGLIIWPGEITNPPPKGWVIPTNGKRLKVGVPVKDGFHEFVEVVQDPMTNVTTVKGYCIDIFEAVMGSLPYAVSYDYVPFATPDGKSAGTYNDLVYQVYLGNFDIVAGDTTIIANRSNYVDFTMPYTESGYSMIVPVKNANRKTDAWVFLMPLTWELWLTTFLSFGFVGITVWVLEHRVNEDFRGTASQQAGMIPWFSLSTMVFAHKEKIVSNLARFVVIIWCFVVLILTQSYTASLTTMLTVQQLHPTVTDINELVKNGDRVGYEEYSFVRGFLQRNKIEDRNLVVFKSPEELHELFSNGSIAAAFDEMPYMKLFLSKYCSKYIMVQPTYKTDGFGFAFPIGSPLVHDVSRSILHVTQGDEMMEIEKKWFGGFGQADCRDSGTSPSSIRLGLESFWGLFLLTGIASVLALLVFTCIFVHKHKHVLSRLPPDASLWRKIKELARQFDMKDLSSHTFRNSEARSRRDVDCICGQQVSPSLKRHQDQQSFSHYNMNSLTVIPLSPSTISDQTGGNVSFRGCPNCPENGEGRSHFQATQGMVPCPVVQFDDPNHNATLNS